MKKYLLIIILFLANQSSVLSQDVDSMTIVNLKKKLPSLKDTARINCLLDIGGEYSNWGHDTMDSVKLYVTIAKKESEVMRSEERRVGKECRSRWSPYR